MFDLPSFTESRSLLSEMKQLQFRNIKQLGNYPVSVGSYSPCQSTLHTVFSYLFFLLISMGSLKERAESVLFFYASHVAGPS